MSNVYVAIIMVWWYDFIMLFVHLLVSCVGLYFIVNVCGQFTY